MSNKHGDWIWYELMTPDARAATAFYGAVLDWNVGEPMAGGMDYREIQAADGDFIGGMLPLTAEMQSHGARPCWLGYIAVDDVDKTLASIGKAGGTTLMPARDIPNVGRIAMVSDPQGVPFYVMKGVSEGKSRAFSDDVPRPGHCAWNELLANDQAAALAFYGTQFGWVQDGAMDMGPMGSYAFIRHGFVLGAMMTKPPQVPAPGWNFYFRVTDIHKAIAAVKAGGGQVINGPMDVPGGDMIINGLDPQGAAFSLVGKVA